MFTTVEKRDGTLTLLDNDAAATYALESGKGYLRIQQCDSSYEHLAIETTYCSELA